MKAQRRTSTETPHAGTSSPAEPWSRASAEVSASLDVDPDRGLSPEEAARRRERHGPNRLRAHETRGLLEIAAAQFRSVIVLLLAVAALLSFVFGSVVEAGAIVAVLVINALIGFLTELRAVKSMESLRELADVPADVRRDGEVRRISARELVPGDVVVLEGGDVVTADMRLVEASRLQVDESALTGESVPVEKGADPVPAETPLADRTSMLYKGTAVTRGSAVGVVTSTGMETELGHISSLVEEASGEEKTPLEHRLTRMGRRLVWVTLGLAGIVVASGLAVGKDALQVVETAIALAVAAIPEGLPIVATLALARGMWRMASRNALVERLSAVETLGSTTVILTDKTGTLTENRMRIARIGLEGGDVEVAGEEPRFRGADGPVDPGAAPALERVLRVGVLCNDAGLPDPETGEPPPGDPMETALLETAVAGGVAPGKLREDAPEVGREAFDPDAKMMATFHGDDGRVLVAVKGAPEAVLEASDRVLAEDGERELSPAERSAWLERSDRMADGGLRLLAMAERRTDDVPGDPYRGLLLLGLVGFLDPPREDVRRSIEACHRAGVRVVMVTGDHPSTARNVADAVGIGSPDGEVLTGAELEAEAVDRRDGDVVSASVAADDRLRRVRVFARTSPAQKLRLLGLHQAGGEVVAMIGDGVNDAPALEKADIGVAMGRRGTQVAREAADVILQDDRFATIVTAVEQGRAIFTNIRKFVSYLLSCNASEILVVTLATLAGAPLPILPLQILFLNLVTDVFPALALGVVEGAPDLMRRPPRDPEEDVLTRRHWWIIGGYGVLITAAVLVGFWIALDRFGLSGTRAVTVSFLVLALGQLWHVFNMAEPESGVIRNEVTRSPVVWGAVGLCVALILGAVYLPGLSAVLELVPPDPEVWAMIVGLSLVPVLAGRLIAVGHSR